MTTMPRPSTLLDLGRAAALGLLAVLSPACASLTLELPQAPDPQVQTAAFTQGRALVDLDHLARVEARAEAAPEDVRAQWQAAMAYSRATLEGHVDQRAQAERYLERARGLDPKAERVPAARVLVRFLNMRSAVGDFSRVGQQRVLYEELLAGAGRPSAGRSRFDAVHLESLHASVGAMAQYADGRPLAALRALAAMEDEMSAHIAAHPEDIDARTMAANFELTFAGIVPVGRHARLEWGMEELAVQQAHWDQLSPRARSEAVAPNVRTVFAFQLAEALVAAGELGRAEAAYDAVVELDALVPETTPRAQLVGLAQGRLEQLRAGATFDEGELLPPWPRAVTGCVACHSETANLPTEDLHAAPLISFVGGQP